MNQALEKITRRRVKATEGRSYRTYKCPECLGPVFFVDPPAQVAHFRHMPNTAKKDCSLYHVAHGHDISNIFQQRAFRPKQPRLFVRIVDDKEPKQWELVLLVPRIDEFTEFAVNKCANRGRIQMRGVTDRGRECPVFPAADRYQIALFNRNQEPEVECMEGLGSLAIFRLSGDLGARVEGSEHLVAGAAYVVLHDIGLNIAPPPEVKSLEMDQRDSWKAFIFQIPEIISEPARNWANRILGATLRASVPVASVLWPPMVERLNDGTWGVSDKCRIVVGFQATTSGYRRARLVHADGASPAEATVLGSRSLIRIEPLEIGYHELRFDDETIPGIPIAVTGAGLRSRCASLTFEIVDKNGSRLESLWSAALPTVLRDVAVKKAQLRRINLPKRCPVVFKSGIGRKVKQLDFLGTDQVGESERLRVEILEHLTKTEVRFEIDAGGFGTLKYRPEEPRPRHTTKHMVSSRSKWLELATLGLPNQPSEEMADEAEALRAHARQRGQFHLQL